MLSQFTAGIAALVDQFFADPKMVSTISYSLYQGRGVDPKIFDIPIVWTSHAVGDTSLTNDIVAQHGKRTGIIRVADLTLESVTKAELTLNDRCTEGTVEYSVTGLNKTLPDYVEITVEGGN